MEPVVGYHRLYIRKYIKHCRNSGFWCYSTSLSVVYASLNSVVQCMCVAGAVDVSAVLGQSVSVANCRFCARNVDDVADWLMHCV